MFNTLPTLPMHTHTLELFPFPRNERITRHVTACFLTLCLQALMSCVITSALWLGIYCFCHESLTLEKRAVWSLLSHEQVDDSPLIWCVAIDPPPQYYTC